MKKPFVLIAAIVAVVGLGTGVAVAKETTKVRTSVKLEYSANGAADSSFSGQVKARKGCQKGAHGRFMGPLWGASRFR